MATASLYVAVRPSLSMTEDMYQDHLQTLRDKYRIASSDEQREEIKQQAQDFKYAWSVVGADGERKHPVDYMQQKLLALAEKKKVTYPQARWSHRE